MEIKKTDPDGHEAEHMPLDNSKSATEVNIKLVKVGDDSKHDVNKILPNAAHDTNTV